MYDDEGGEKWMIEEEEEEVKNMEINANLYPSSGASHINICLFDISIKKLAHYVIFEENRNEKEEEERKKN